MKGGFNNPPNDEFLGHEGALVEASMKGGFNNPPNEADAATKTKTKTLQ